MRPYYEHDGITIYHGDCRDILPTLAPAHPCPRRLALGCDHCGASGDAVDAIASRYPHFTPEAPHVG